MKSNMMIFVIIIAILVIGAVMLYAIFKLSNKKSDDSSTGSSSSSGGSDDPDDKRPDWYRWYSHRHPRPRNTVGGRGLSDDLIGIDPIVSWVITITIGILVVCGLTTAQLLFLRHIDVAWWYDLMFHGLTTAITVWFIRACLKGRHVTPDNNQTVVFNFGRKNYKIVRLSGTGPKLPWQTFQNFDLDLDYQAVETTFETLKDGGKLKSLSKLWFVIANGPKYMDVKPETRIQLLHELAERVQQAVGRLLGPIWIMRHPDVFSALCMWETVKPDHAKDLLTQGEAAHLQKMEKLKKKHQRDEAERKRKHEEAEAERKRKHEEAEAERKRKHEEAEAERKLEHDEFQEQRKKDHDEFLAIAPNNKKTPFRREAFVAEKFKEVPFVPQPFQAKQFLETPFEASKYFEEFDPLTAFPPLKELDIPEYYYGRTGLDICNLHASGDISLVSEKAQKAYEDLFSEEIEAIGELEIELRRTYNLAFELGFQIGTPQFDRFMRDVASKRGWRTVQEKIHTIDVSSFAELDPQLVGGIVDAAKRIFTIRSVAGK